MIKSNGDKFLRIHNIHFTQECPNEYFEKIIKKAHNKEKPFDSKKVDGFKDALIWYSIIDYLMNEHIEKEDLIFFFTNNKRDFDSETTLAEFKTMVQNDLHIIGFEKLGPLYNFEYRDFLKYILKEAQNTKITNIQIEYSEFEDSFTIENILADPFPSNLVSLIDISCLERTKCKKLLKDQILQLLRNFDFIVDLEEIKCEYKKLPNIGEITVFLEFYEEGRFYEINSIEIMFEDGDTIESDYENIIIPEDCIKQLHSPPDYRLYEIDSDYNDNIAKMISKLTNRKIDPNVITCYF